MKKFLALMLALIMCVGVLAACGGNNETSGATLDEAKELLTSMMKDKNGKATPNDYDVVGKLKVGDTTFEITWATDNDNIKVKESSKKDFWTIDVPSVNEKEVEYKLTATIKAADGSTVEVTFTPKLPVVDNSGVETEFKAGVAYKIFLKQANLGYDVYALNTTQDNENKFINTTMDPKAAATFYVEVVDGGYKIYTEIEGVKNYLHATATPKESGTGFTKTIGFATESDCVYTYDSELSLFKVKLSGEYFGVGTYNAYETISISELKYFKADNINVEGGQFPIGIMTAAHADTLPPSVKPENNDPESTTPSVDVQVVDAPVAGTAYKFGAVQGNVDNKLLFINGQMANTHYFGTTVNAADAIDVYVEAVTGGYNLYYMNGTTKTYINIKASGQYVNVKYETSDPTVYTFDATLKTFVVDVTCENESKTGTYCFGTYGTFETVSPTMTSKDLFPCQFYTVVGAEGGEGEGEGGGTTPVEKTPAEKITQELAALEIDNFFTANAEITLPATGTEFTDVTFTYTVTGSSIAFDATTNKLTVTAGDLDKNNVVKVTASITGADPVEKEYEITVIKVTDLASAIIAAENAPENNLNFGEYEVKGVISTIDYAYSTQNKNITVTIVLDGTETKLKCYKLSYDIPDGQTEDLCAGLKIGDTITVKGIISNYNGEAQIKGKLLTLEEGNIPPEAVTIPQALEKEENTYVSVSGIVVDVTTWNTQHGNMNATIMDADGKSILLYRTTTQVALGDYVTAVGYIGQFNNVNRIAQGSECTIGTADDAHKAVFALSQVSIETEYNADVNATLPTTSADATLTWKKGEDTITSLTATQTEEKQTITLTVTATVGEATATKDITVTVNAKPAEGSLVASKTISELIESENWTDSTTKQEFTLDAVVSVKVNGGNNSGKAYGDHIRIYATDSPAGSLTITLADGYELVSVKISTSTDGTYAHLCVDGTTTDISNISTTVSGSSVLINSVKNGSNGKQVRVTAIEVVYKQVNA